MYVIENDKFFVKSQGYNIEYVSSVEEATEFPTMLEAARFIETFQIHGANIERIGD